MLSEGSRDTKVMLKIQLCVTGINYILIYIKMGKRVYVYLYVNDLLTKTDVICVR